VVRKTETNILKALAKGDDDTATLTADQRRKLLAKMSKDQSKSRGRSIDALTENEFETMMLALTDGDEKLVRRSVKDYTMHSTAINNSCREGELSGAAKQVDAMFQIFVKHGFTNTPRIVYRLLTYKPNSIACPYGATAGDRIAVGDLISDSAFMSTSEHRQFLVNGIKDPKPGTVFVKFIIHGRGGVNISGAAHYTNAMQKQVMQQLNPKTHMFRTADAGQAEILYPRNVIMRVDSIVKAGRNWHVAATIPNPIPNSIGVKNGYTGT
jgi:insecticidal toxin complex protein TccC